MGPSTLSIRAPYLGSEIHGPGTQVDSGRTLKPTPVAQARSGGNHTLGLKSMAQVFKPTPVAQARSGGNCTLGLKSMARVLKPTPVAQVDANGRTQARSGGNCTLGLKSMAQVLKPTPVAQADSGRNLKPSPAAKLLVFLIFYSLWLSGKCSFVFCILSPPHVAQSRLL
jgi:hypothetical protein